MSTQQHTGQGTTPEPPDFGSARSDYGEHAYGGRLDEQGLGQGGPNDDAFEQRDFGGGSTLNAPASQASSRASRSSRRSRAAESRGSAGIGSTVCWLLTGVTVGAGLMYLFDPERGGRRRALLRDKCASLSNQTCDTLGRASRDLSNRARGLAAEASRAAGRPWPHERERGNNLQEATQMEG